MKRILMVLLWCGLFGAVSSYAQETATWDLARDLQISFTQGANGVWYFMESESRVHDPSVYRLLPKYLKPCQGQGKVFAGVGCWQGTEARIPDCFQRGCGLKTEVGFNFTNKYVPYEKYLDQEFLAGYFPRWPHLLANWDRYAIVAWQSPLNGAIDISARFTWKNVISIGMDWSVDKGNQTLRSGHIYSYPDGGQVELSRLPVVKGDVLYFIVEDPWPDYHQANPVLLRATITQVE